MIYFCLNQILSINYCKQVSKGEFSAENERSGEGGCSGEVEIEGGHEGSVYIYIYSSYGDQTKHATEDQS